MMVTKDFKPDRWDISHNPRNENTDIPYRLNVHLAEDGTVSHVDHQ
jgi:hypothetical protein